MSPPLSRMGEVMAEADDNEKARAQTRERMRRYRDRLRESGLKEIMLWVTSREERAIRKFLRGLRGK